MAIFTGSGTVVLNGRNDRSLAVSGSGGLTFSAAWALTPRVQAWNGTDWLTAPVTVWKGSAWVAPVLSTVTSLSALAHGMYGGPGGNTVIDSYMSSTGNTVTLAQDMADTTSWATLTSTSNLAAWNTWCGVSAARRLVYSLGLLTTSDDPGLTTGQKYSNLCAGLYDAYFHAIGQAFASYPNLTDATIRLAPRVNEAGHPWSVQPGDPDQLYLYHYAYNRVAAILRQECPGLTFEWAPVMGSGWTQRSLADIYPGDGFVDFVGMVVNDWSPVNGDTSNNRFNWIQTSTNGLNDQLGLAVAQGKRMALSWGLVQNTLINGYYGGGDDPGFVDLLINWMSNNGYKYSIYNNTNLLNGIDSRLSSYSTANDKYNSLWASGLNHVVLMTSPTLTTSPILTTKG